MNPTLEARSALLRLKPKDSRLRKAGFRTKEKQGLSVRTNDSPTPPPLSCLPAANDPRREAGRQRLDSWRVTGPRQRRGRAPCRGLKTSPSRSSGERRSLWEIPNRQGALHRIRMVTFAPRNSGLIFISNHNPA
uniref:Uncharacterized protein n=1 Tax=Sphaerodactylus townsendi TaxID=933632 RepID=A0ACB8GC37_9SAUR